MMTRLVRTPPRQPLHIVRSPCTMFSQQQPNQQNNPDNQGNQHHRPNDQEEPSTDKPGAERGTEVHACCSARVDGSLIQPAAEDRGDPHAEQKQEQRHPTDDRGHCENDHPDRPGRHEPEPGHEIFISSAREWRRRAAAACTSHHYTPSLRSGRKESAPSKERDGTPGSFCGSLLCLLVSQHQGRWRRGIQDRTAPG
jgi:hypothetical protein